jgi:hypothetical protein
MKGWGPYIVHLSPSTDEKVGENPCGSKRGRQGFRRVLRVGQCWNPSDWTEFNWGNDSHSDAKRGPNSHTFKLSEKATKTLDKTLKFSAPTR